MLFRSSGAAQVCCYDDFGYLMFSQDYEYNPHYMRFFGAGVPYRAHPWGVFPYRRAPYIPAFSNFINDLLPYEACCLWAGRCEFYYWRRMTSGCQGYTPPAIGNETSFFIIINSLGNNHHSIVSFHIIIINFNNLHEELQKFFTYQFFTIIKT